jgi:hypothetical protein
MPSGTLAGWLPITGGAVRRLRNRSDGTGLQAGRTYTVVAYTVDQHGSVSAPAESTVTF